MKASEFVGMKVLDKEANEVGKVEEIGVVFGTMFSRIRYSYQWVLHLTESISILLTMT